jgi:hypothetical protein
MKSKKIDMVINEEAAVSEIMDARKAYDNYAISECLEHITKQERFFSRPKN